MANLIRGLSENGGVVFCGVDSTQIVRKAEKLHTTCLLYTSAMEEQESYEQSQQTEE